MRMLKFTVLFCAILPSAALATDYVAVRTIDVHKHSCGVTQSGDSYCIDAPPIEKYTTDCDAGMNCNHMQSGQHYSVQRPVIVD